MGVNFFVFVNRLKNVWCGWSIGEFKFIEGFLGDLKFVAFLKVLDGDMLEYFADFIVSIFIMEVSFHNFFLKFWQIFLEFVCFYTFIPLAGLDSNLLKTLWYLPMFKVI